MSFSSPFEFTPILDPTHFHCIRYLGPPLNDSNFNKSSFYYLFQSGDEEESFSFVAPLAFTWTSIEAKESKLILPLWMRKMFPKPTNYLSLKFKRILDENVSEFDGILKVEWFLLNSIASFPFEEVLPELLGSKRPLSKNGTVIPFVYKGIRYALKFSPIGACENEIFWFNFERGTLQIVSNEEREKNEKDYLDLLKDGGSWEDEYKILKYQIENISEDSKEIFLLCGIPLQLQEGLLKSLGIKYEKFLIHSMIQDEHLQIDPSNQPEPTRDQQNHFDFIFIDEVEKISPNLMTEILKHLKKYSKIILTTSSRSIESSPQLIQLEKTAKRFNFQVINCNFPSIKDEEKIKIVSMNDENDEVQVSKYKWTLKSMNFTDLLRICKSKDDLSLDLEAAINSVKGTEEKSGIYSCLSLKEPGNFQFFGYKKIKEDLVSLIKGPLINSEAYERFNLPKSSGFFLYGPTGCGKTSLCMNILSTFGNLFTVIPVPSASEILSKYFGETEANIRRLFSLARERKPSIIFIDQIECLGLKRGLQDDTGGSSSRYLSTLLNEMDGISGNEGVTIIACANDIKMLDEALLRPGRLDRHFYLGLPEREDRIDIIKGFLEGQYEDLLNETEGMTGAEIKSLHYANM